MEGSTDFPRKNSIDLLALERPFDVSILTMVEFLMLFRGWLEPSNRADQDRDANIIGSYHAADPTIRGNRMLVSSGADAGGTLFDLGMTPPRELWRNTNLKSAISSAVLWQGYLYGFNAPLLSCLSGKRARSNGSPAPAGSGTCAGRHQGENTPWVLMFNNPIETLAIALNMDGQEQGVFFVPPAGRISDLMLALGLAVPRESDGDMGSRRLQAGDKVYLSSISPEPPVVGKMSAAQSLGLDLPIDINQASLEELILVPGIGERTAARIIAFRSAKKKFRNLAELMELRGIKENKFGKLKRYFFVSP